MGRDPSLSSRSFEYQIKIDRSVEVNKAQQIMNRLIERFLNYFSWFSSPRFLRLFNFFFPSPHHPITHNTTQHTQAIPSLSTPPSIHHHTRSPRPPHRVPGQEGPPKQLQQRQIRVQRAPSTTPTKPTASSRNGPPVVVGVGPPQRLVARGEVEPAAPRNGRVRQGCLGLAVG